MKRLTLMVLALVSLLAISAALAKPAYFIQADIVRGAIGSQGAVCVANGVFLQGEQMVFRAYVYDSDTGELLTQADLDTRGIKVEASLVDGDVTVPMVLGAHPAPGAPNADTFFSAAFVIPADFATGQYQWTVSATDAAGGEGVYQPMGHGAGLGAVTITQPASSAQ